MIRSYLLFLVRCGRVALKGDWRYHGWLAFLFIVSLIGLNAYMKQLVHGLAITDLSNDVSWGVYIANFTFMVGIADAAVMLRKRGLGGTDGKCHQVPLSKLRLQEPCKTWIVLHDEHIDISG